MVVKITFYLYNSTKGAIMQKIVLITGASGGLGNSLAKKLDAEGYLLALSGRSLEKLNLLNESLGGKHLVVQGDPTKVEDCENTIQKVQKEIGVPVGLAHCVGNIRLGSIHKMSIQDLQDCLNVNLMSALYILKPFVDTLIKTQNKGSCVFVSSIAAQIGTPNHEAIASAKGGIEALCRSAAASYSNYGIRFNAVAPGLMDTPAASKIISSPIAREAASKQYPIGGIGSSEELAELMYWLLSEKAARVTGQTWTLDGGFTAVRPFVK